ncbi:MAG: TlpA disulfide reductase family protein [bacterium]|nr:TlpA disulfide reductase family protein [bacterium]
MMLSAISQAEVLLKTSNGQNISFTSLKGKWVIFNYWAGWCHTCIDEIPELNRFYLQHKNDPVALFAVNYDALSIEKQKKLIKKFKIKYPSLINDPAQELKLGDIKGVPVTFIFNTQGQLTKTLYGGQTEQSLNQIISQ